MASGRLLVHALLLVRSLAMPAVPLAGSGPSSLQEGGVEDALRMPRLPRLLLYTSVLGGDAAWERASMLPLFLWSARKAPDVDILLIGNGKLCARAPSEPATATQARPPLTCWPSLSLSLSL